MAKTKNNAGAKVFEGKNILFTKNVMKSNNDINDFIKEINKLNGTVLAHYSKKLNFIIGDEEDSKKQNKTLARAKEWKETFIVTIDFIKACLKENKLVDHEKYLLIKDEDGSDDKVNKGVKRNLKESEDKNGFNVDKSAKISDSACIKAVDIHFPNRMDAQVLYKDGIFYDAMMNQTNLGQNNNKFFIIQLIFNPKIKHYHVWTRWGRVGANGQCSNKCFKDDLDEAIREFEAKFQSKSGNIWQKLPYEHRKGKYFVMERDYEEEEEEDDINDNTEGSLEKASKKSKTVIESKLEPRVYELVKLIFDSKMMNESMSSLSYDTKKMPLGKLTKDHIKKGMQVLKDISDEMLKKQPSKDKLVDLSSLFYTIIPHAYGMRAPPIINNQEMLKQKLEMVESLGEIQIANTIMKKFEDQTDINPVDANYHGLENQIKPLDKDGKTYKMIEDYVKNTHGETHNWYDLVVKDAFELVRDGEEERFKEYETFENKKLLWHGSRLTNFVGILSQGLRIAPPEAPATGYMFGKGVYFADIVSKSANYCASGSSSNMGLMLLCEVALGSELPLIHADYHADQKVKNQSLHCTKGIGRVQPNPESDKLLDNGVIVPMGKPIKGDRDDAYLQYNEFIVYKTEQIKMKYLIKLDFVNKY